MQVVFALLVALFAIALSARKFTGRIRMLMVLSICAMIVVITFTHYGG